MIEFVFLKLKLQMEGQKQKNQNGNEMGWIKRLRSEMSLNWIKYSVLFFILFFEAPIQLWAKTTSAYQPTTVLVIHTKQPNFSNISTASLIFHLIVALVVTIALLYLTVWGLKLVWDKRSAWRAPVETNQPIKILTSTYLSPRKVVYLVEIGKRILVLGVGTNEISKLETIEDADEIQAIKQVTSTQTFPTLLQKILHRQQIEKETQEIFDQGHQTLSEYTKKLKETSKRISDKSDQDSEKK